MTDSNGNWGWGVGAAAIIGGALGYWAGNGNKGCNNGCGSCADGYNACTVSSIQSRVEDLAAANKHNATLDAIGGVSDKLVGLTKDTYQLGIQNLKSNEDLARMIENNACRTNDIVNFDGEKTRAAVDAMKSQYLSDRIHDLELENSQLKSNIALAPLTCAIGDIQKTLAEVTGCKGVKICKACECIPA